MPSENAIYLAKHRINNAKEDLETAFDLLKMEDTKELQTGYTMRYFTQ